MDDAYATPEEWTQIAFGLSVAMSAFWLITQPLLGAGKWPNLIVVVACHIWFVVRQRRHPAVSSTAILAATAGLVVVAVVVPPYGSRDLWSYSMYGRIVGIHHASPYTNSPASFPGDPLLSHVDRLWRHTPSVYGPLFNLVSGIGALGYRASPLRARLFYQSMAGVALLSSLALLVRRRVPSWVLGLIGMAPGALIAVNGGHVDMLVGLGVLATLLLMVDERYVLGAVVLALTVMIKIVALPVVAGVGVALLLARRWRPALTVGAIVAGVVGAGYAVAGGLLAARPALNGSRLVSRTSIVNGVHDLYSTLRVGPWPWLAQSGARSAVAMLLAAAAFAAFAWNRRHRPEVATFAVAAMLVYLLTANYVLPWYAMAVFPAVALVGARLRWYGLAVVVLLQFAYIRADRHHVPGSDFVANIGPIIELVLLALVIWRSRVKPTRRSRAGPVELARADP